MFRVILSASYWGSRWARASLRKVPAHPDALPIVFSGCGRSLMIKETMAQTKVRMGKALEDFRHELATVRTGRASASLLDHIKVEYYGTPTPLNQVATLGVPEPSLLTVQPWDTSLLAAIDKSIRSSDLGLNPVNDGKVLRVPIPPLTEERRKELVRHLHRVMENHRTALRNIR